jgi:hypothetical protein
MGGAHTAYVWIKIVLLFLASLFLTHRAATELYTASKESSATRFRMERFPAQYAGQRWLELTGRPLTESAAIMPESGKYARDGYARVYIPLVSAVWKPGEPIHAVIAVGSWPEGQCKERLNEMASVGEQTFGGLAGSPMANDRLFPGMSIGEPFVHVNAGQAPEGGGGMVFLLALGIVLFCVTGFFIYRALRQLQIARRSLGQPAMRAPEVPFRR